MRYCLFLAFVVYGCGWESDGLARLDDLYPREIAADIVAEELLETDTIVDQAGDVTGDEPGVGDIEGEIAPIMTGTWAFVAEQHGLLFDLYRMTINDLFIASVTGNQISLSFCKQDVTFQDDPGVGNSYLDEKTVASLGETSIIIPLSNKGTIEETTVIWTWGINPEYKNCPLPASADEKAVWDQDEDGKPGVTVHVEDPKGDRYMVRRVEWRLETGEQVGDIQMESLDGTLQFEPVDCTDPCKTKCLVEQVALGATNSLLMTAAPICVDQDTPSYWRMRKLSESYDCKKLKEEWKTLFNL